MLNPWHSRTDDQQSSRRGRRPSAPARCPGRERSEAGQGHWRDDTRLALAAPVGRAGTDHGVEHPGQVALVGEAAARGDDADAFLGPLEHFPGAANALAQQPAMRRRAHAGLERLGEMAAREAAQARELRRPDGCRRGRRATGATPRSTCQGARPPRVSLLHFAVASHGRILVRARPMPIGVPEIQRHNRYRSVVSFNQCGRRRRIADTGRLSSAHQLHPQPVLACRRRPTDPL